MQVRVVEGVFGSTPRRVARGDRLAPGARILVPSSFLSAPQALSPGETVRSLGWAETARRPATLMPGTQQCISVIVKPVQVTGSLLDKVTAT